MNQRICHNQQRLLSFGDLNFSQNKSLDASSIRCTALAPLRLLSMGLFMGADSACSLQPSMKFIPIKYSPSIERLEAGLQEQNEEVLEPIAVLRKKVSSAYSPLLCYYAGTSQQGSSGVISSHAATSSAIYHQY